MNLFINKNFFVRACLFLLLGLFPFFSCYSKEGNEPPVKVMLTGSFTTVGNAPFIKLVFRADSGETYEVDTKEAGRYNELQGRKMIIEAVAIAYTMETADHKIKKKFYRIKEIKVTGSPE